MTAMAAGCLREPDARDASGAVTRRTIVERGPTGTRTTVITTRVSPAEPPPARPADSYPADPLVKYNVELINGYRAKAGIAPVAYDATISEFAEGGSRQYAADHTPHAHFAAHVKGAPGFGSRSAENQGDPNGVPPMDADRMASGKKQIGVMMKLMMDEGPGGGHHDTILNAHYRRVGIGLHTSNGKLYLTNDFSD